VADGRRAASLRGLSLGDVCHGGTILAGTRAPLVSWFAAIWYVVNQKQGISALGLQRVLGLGSYETAWRGCTRCAARWYCRGACC
jgi:hypothetical protein